MHWGGMSRDEVMFALGRRFIYIANKSDEPWLKGVFWEKGKEMMRLDVDVDAMYL